SSDPSTVARLGSAYIEALQAQGILAVAKHFPGHGATSEDSHLTLPVLNATRERLETVDLLPFRAALEANVAGVMTAHVSYPSLDPSTRRPGSLSSAIVAGVLRTDLAFDGLVITDDLGVMRAVTDLYTPGEA